MIGASIKLSFHNKSLLDYILDEFDWFIAMREVGLLNAFPILLLQKNAKTSIPHCTIAAHSNLSLSVTSPTGIQRENDTRQSDKDLWAERKRKYLHATEAWSVHSTHKLFALQSTRFISTFLAFVSISTQFGLARCSMTLKRSSDKRKMRDAQDQTQQA